MKKYLYIGSLLVILILSVVVFGQTETLEKLRLHGVAQPGLLVVANESNAPVIVLRGTDGQISSGGNGMPGRLRIANAQNESVISLNGETGRLNFINGGGIRFGDGSVQKTAQLKGADGARGPQGFRGEKGEKGDKGDNAPPGLAKTVAVCQNGAPISCPCEGGTVTRVFGTCAVSAETGSCSNTGPGCCAICR